MTLTVAARLHTVTGVTTRAATSNILTYWDRATEDVRTQGADWYPLAGSLVAELAAQCGRPTDTVAAVVAHLSPRTSWKRNILGAREILAGGEAIYCLAMNRRNAARALASPDPLNTFSAKAVKARAFAHNILGDERAVTVDVWAAKIALDRTDIVTSGILQRQGIYAAVAHAYRLAAKRAGVSPAVMQATTWIVARNGRVS